jgi:hypothetical protein
MTTDRNKRTASLIHLGETVRGLFHRKNALLLFGFALYLILMIGFAYVYYAIYQLDRYAFLFARDIQISQNKLFSTEASLRTTEITHKEEAIRQAVTHLRIQTGKEQNAKQRYSIALSDGMCLVLGHGSAVAFPGSASVWRTLSVEDANSHNILSWNPGGDRFWPRDRTSIIHALEAEANRLAAERSTIHSRLLSINTDRPDVWSFSDFLYFSVITQGTVGYGDIVPNTTSVRLVVVLQIVAGYMVLVVLINWAIWRSRSAQKQHLNGKDSGN